MELNELMIVADIVVCYATTAADTLSAPVIPSYYLLEALAISTASTLLLQYLYSLIPSSEVNSMISALCNFLSLLAGAANFP
jgi:hypothetical protein